MRSEIHSLAGEDVTSFINAVEWYCHSRYTHIAQNEVIFRDNLDGKIINAKWNALGLVTTNTKYRDLDYGQTPTIQ